MSKIIREEIVAPIRMVSAGVMSTLAAVNKIENAINQREAEFAELVEAAVAWITANSRDTVNIIDVGDKLRTAVKPFLPPPSPADRLDELALSSEDLNTTEAIMKIRAIAAELRGGEK